MAQDLMCNCRMLYNSAVLAILVLFTIVPITGQGTNTNTNSGAGLDPAFVNDPFHSQNAYPNNAHQQPPSPYHYNSDPYQAGSHYPQYPQYPYYNNNPAPSTQPPQHYNQYQHNSHYPNQNAGSYQYAPSTTVSPAPVPAAPASGGEEYEAEDGRPGSSGAGAGAGSPTSHLSRQAPAQYHWYYGNYGGGKTGSYRTGGLLEALRPQQRYYQQQQQRPRTNVFNTALPLLFALNAW